jgi:hypothetical protein
VLNGLRTIRRRALGIARWASTAAGILAQDKTSSRRLLIVYDLSAQPFSVGDILIFQEASLVLRERFRLHLIDFAIVFDPRQPVVADPAFRSIDAESFLFHLSYVLPAAQFNAHVGSLFLFDSHRQLESFIAESGERYRTWPDLGLYASREYLFYRCFNELFHEHYTQHGALPPLQPRPAAAAWARRFLEEHAPGRVAVTVQLRRNPANPPRDSRYDEWIAFLEYCASRYPVTFFVICAHAEIDPRLRGTPNVVVVKDYATGLEQDLALIAAAHFHMGAASGPGTIAQFNVKPYCIFGWKVRLDLLEHVVQEDHRHRFLFSGPLQNWIMQEESCALLVSEFERLWEGAGYARARDDSAAPLPHA